MSIFSCLTFGQTAYEKEIRQWQQELNASFADKEKSPLERKALRKFEGLDFFPIDKKYRIKATFVRTPDELPFTMPTTQNQVQVYEKYGEAHFTLDSQKIVLPIYQNNRLKQEEAFKKYLFLPFTDPTNGFDSYGGGRYLDLQIPEGDSIIIDFNKAYNPSCAYNAKYVCPIPPRENDIPVAIKAGVMDWEK